VVSGKGGVGKTTVAVNLAALAVARGKRVVVVDLDPTGGASYAGGADPIVIAAANQGVHAALAAPQLLDSLVLRTADGWELLTGSALLSRDEPKALTSIPPLIAALGEQADLVVIDCAPGFGLFSRAAALTATDVIVPISLEPLAMQTVPIVLELLDVLEIPRKRVAGFVPNQVDSRLLLAAAQLEELQKLAGSIPVLTAIPRTTAAAVAALAGRAVVTYAPTSTASIAFAKLADVLGM